MVICQYCNNHAEFVGGDVIYPHRPDLYDKKFYVCKPCGAYVGVHAPNKKHGFTGVEPLGTLANIELRGLRNRVHAAFDPAWKSGLMSRNTAYRKLAHKLGITVDKCHVAMFDEATCRRVLKMMEGN